MKVVMRIVNKVRQKKINKLKKKNNKIKMKLVMIMKNKKTNKARKIVLIKAMMIVKKLLNKMKIEK